MVLSNDIAPQPPVEEFTHDFGMTGGTRNSYAEFDTQAVAEGYVDPYNLYIRIYGKMPTVIIEKDSVEIRVFLNSNYDTMTINLPKSCLDTYFFNCFEEYGNESYYTFMTWVPLMDFDKMSVTTSSKEIIQSGPFQGLNRRTTVPLFRLA